MLLRLCFLFCAFTFALSPLHIQESHDGLKQFDKIYHDNSCVIYCQKHSDRAEHRAGDLKRVYNDSFTQEWESIKNTQNAAGYFNNYQPFIHFKAKIAIISEAIQNITEHAPEPIHIVITDDMYSIITSTDLALLPDTILSGYNTGEYIDSFNLRALEQQYKNNPHSRELIELALVKCCGVKDGDSKMIPFSQQEKGDPRDVTLLNYPQFIATRDMTLFIHTIVFDREIITQQGLKQSGLLRAVNLIQHVQFYLAFLQKYHTQPTAEEFARFSKTIYDTANRNMYTYDAGAGPKQ